MYIIIERNTTLDMQVPFQAFPLFWVNKILTTCDSSIS